MIGAKRSWLLIVSLVTLLSLACQVTGGMSSTRQNPDKEIVQGSSGRPLAPSGGVPTRTLAAPAGGPGSLANAFASGYTPAAPLAQPLALRAPEESLASPAPELSPTPTLPFELTATLEATATLPAPSGLPGGPATAAPAAAATATGPALATATPRPTATSGGGASPATATVATAPPASGAPASTPIPTTEPTATQSGAYPGSAIATNTPYP